MTRARLNPGVGPCLLAAFASMLILTVGFGVSGAARAHSGGLDRNGCHTNHKTGEYHCHRPQGRSAPAPAPPPRRAGGSAYYANCSAARAAGAAPILRGEPGYRPALDRDNDGVACE